MSPTVQEEARKQWAIDQNGPLSIYNLPQLISYFKSDNVLGSSEFEELDTQHQKALKAKAKPSYEIFSVSLISHRDPAVKRNISLRLGLNARLHVYIADLVDLYEIIAAKILAGEDLPSGERGFYFSETGHHSWKNLSQGVGDVLSKLCIAETKEAKSMSLEIAATGFAVGDKILAEIGFTSKYIMRTTLYISDTDADLHATAQGLSQNVVDVLVGDPGGIRPI